MRFLFPIALLCASCTLTLDITQHDPDAGPELDSGTIGDGGTAGTNTSGTGGSSGTGNSGQAGASPEGGTGAVSTGGATAGSGGSAAGSGGLAGQAGQAGEGAGGMSSGGAQGGSGAVSGASGDSGSAGASTGGFSGSGADGGSGAASGLGGLAGQAGAGSTGGSSDGGAGSDSGTGAVSGAGAGGDAAGAGAGPGGGSGAAASDAGAGGLGGSSGESGAGSSSGSGSSAGTGAAAGSGAVGGSVGSAGSDAGGVGGSGGDGSGDNPPVAPACPDPSLPTAPGLPVYYVCDCQAGADAGCVAGVDTASGTSPAAPWRTYGKARARFENIATPFTAGGAVAFCRGGAWDVATGEGDTWVNSSCTAANPCVIRDYAPAGLAGAAKPLLRMLGRSGFRFEDSGNANHEEGVTLLNLELVGNGATGRGLSFMNDIDDVLACGLTIRAFFTGVAVDNSNPIQAGSGSDGLNMRITLRNSSISDCPDQGWIGSCDGCSIEYNDFRNNGFGLASSNHNIYISGSKTSAGAYRFSQGMRAVGNTLYRSAFIGGQCTAVSLVSHKFHEDLLIEGNTVYEDVGAAGGGCWGIALDEGAQEAYRRAVIRNNRVINTGGIGIGVNGCIDCRIENNIVLTEQTGFQTIGIAVPDSSTVAPMARVTVRHNTVWLGPANSSSVGVQLSGGTGGHVSVGNTVSYVGPNNNVDCYNYPQVGSAYARVDHNHCWTPNAPSAEWERSSGGLFAWSLTSGFDVASGNAAPMFTSGTAPFDFRPQAGSPLINAGDATNYPPEDINGMARSNPPDVGAVER